MAEYWSGVAQLVATVEQQPAPAFRHRDQTGEREDHPVRTDQGEDRRDESGNKRPSLLAAEEKEDQAGDLGQGLQADGREQEGIGEKGRECEQTAGGRAQDRSGER